MTRLGNRKRDLRMGPYQSWRISYQLGVADIVDGVVINPLWIAGSTLGAINIYMKSLRMACEKLLHARVKLIGMLGQIDAGDSETRLLSRKRINVGAATF